MFLLGSSGILGVVTLATKGIVDAKEEQIKALDRENQRLKTQLGDERGKSTQLVDELRKALESTDAGRLKLEILNLVNKLDTLQKGFDDCKCAAKWIDARKKIWVDRACKEANRGYPELLSRNKTKFKENLTRYLDWVFVCLDKQGHTRNMPISDFVSAPAILSPHPYLSAINYLISQEEWGELTPEQIDYLREVLIQLTEKIRYSFRN